MNQKTMSEREASVAAEQAAKAHTAKDFYEQMEKANLGPLWDRFTQLTVTEPKPRDPGLQYKWEELQSLIERASREVSMKEAERRVFMLLNPAFGGQPLTTTGLYGAIQILLPGESARSHRHTPTAFRFVLEGKGATTFVDNRGYPMEEGDMILTPNWTWHGHKNGSDRRICWYDGLDLVFMVYCNAVFTEHGSDEKVESNKASLPDEAYASGGIVPENNLPPTAYSPKIRFPWSDVVRALDALPPGDDGTKMVRYIDPLTGGPVIPTLDLYALELPKGRETRPFRTTSNAIAIAAEGEGVTRVGETTYKWKKNDIFTLPHWSWITHKAATENARLFLDTDRHLLRSMNLLREERG